MTSGDLLDQAVEELYSADPEEFTRRRGELAARARSAGQAAVARQIAGLRKPMRSAWMINKLVRADPGAAARLTALGEELRAAERSGDGTRMRELSQARRQLIATLVRQALTVSGQHAPPAALREEITATFSAALADPEVAGQIQDATLLRPARRAGFGTAQAPALALVPSPPDTRQAGAGGRKPPRAGPAASRLTARLAADTARTRAERDRHRARADPEQAQAERDRRRAQADAERAQAEQDRRRARDDAEQALADADRAADAARQAAQQQEEAVQRLEQQLTDVRHRLHEARAQARRAESAQRKARHVLDRLRE